jgi:agmatinase
MLDSLENLFIPPEKTSAGYSFMDAPIRISFHDANAILYGIPLDITTSFGKGTRFGPHSIRRTSAKQIESFIMDKNIEIYEKIKIFDIGDLILPNRKTKKKEIEDVFKKISSDIHKINSCIRKESKIPIILGGEHTISYFSVKSITNEDPIVLHFDAHRDMKPSYEGIKLCHTTPFYHLINDGFIKGSNLIQIGIRQTDKEENDIAKRKGVITFDAWQIHKEMKSIQAQIEKLTKGKKIYISFDIDVYDICYVPCTGTPEPFGLNPFQILEIINSINKSSKLIGLDIVEVAMKNGDYREGTLATQTIYRILSKFWN